MRWGEVDFRKLDRLEAIRAWGERRARGGAGVEDDVQPTRRRLSDPVLVPVKPAGLMHVSPAMVNETGVVPCALRMMDGIARDRCAERQREEGCSCQLAPVVRNAVRLTRRWAKEELRRREGGRMAPGRAGNPNGTKYPPWKLKCAYRKCGRPFEAPRHFGHKPAYCCTTCAYREARERRKDRLAFSRRAAR